MIEAERGNGMTTGPDSRARPRYQLDRYSDVSLLSPHHHTPFTPRLIDVNRAGGLGLFELHARRLDEYPLLAFTSPWILSRHDGEREIRTSLRLLGTIPFTRERRRGFRVSAVVENSYAYPRSSSASFQRRRRERTATEAVPVRLVRGKLILVGRLRDLSTDGGVGIDVPLSDYLGFLSWHSLFQPGWQLIRGDRAFPFRVRRLGLGPGTLALGGMARAS